jgi:molybdopterin molybdotransferase
MIGFEEATALVLALARPLEARDVPIEDADGLVLAEPVIAAADTPPGPLSAMDGYAVRDADLEALPARLKVVGTIYAGEAPGWVIPVGACLRIFTGAPVPAGADRVVMQEAVGRDGDWAVFETRQGRGRHIRAAGSDFLAGDTLVASGTQLNAQAMVAAAAADRARLSVHPRPRVIVLSTGDELVAPGQACLNPGAVPDSVSLGVATLVREYGGEVVERIRLKDDPARRQRAAEAALAVADVVVVTGGASVGEKDFARSMFAPVGLELVFGKVAIKPGKPVWIGRARGRLVVGLPGNPTSAMVTARLFLAPLIAGLAGRDPGAALAWRNEPLTGDLPETGDRETFVRGASGSWGVAPLANQDSGAQGMLALADRLIRRNAGAAAGARLTPVEVLDF